MRNFRSLSVCAALAALLVGCSSTAPESGSATEPAGAPSATADTPASQAPEPATTTDTAPGDSIETMMIGTWSCLNSSDVGPAFDQWGKGYDHIRDDAELTITDGEFLLAHDGKEATGTWALADGSLTLTAAIFPENWGGPSKTWTIGNFPMTVDEAQAGPFLTTDAEGEDYQKVSLSAQGAQSVTIQDTEGRTSTCSKA